MEPIPVQKPKLRTVQSSVKIGDEYVPVEMDLTDEEYEKVKKGIGFTPDPERVRYFPHVAKH